MTTYPTLTTTDPKGVQAWSAQLARALERTVPVIGLGRVTLDLNTASTTVSDQLATPGGAVLLSPETSAAAAALATTFIDPASFVAGSFTIEHADATTEDRTFRYLIVEPVADEGR